MDTAETDTLIGTRVFGGYQITQKIGAGGMGAVYLAENRSLGRKLAVKVLLAERSHSDHAVARFLAEAKAASAIRHRNIIDVLDTALLPDGRHYILMEFLEGSTLRSFARAHYPLTLEIVLALLGQVCAGLQAAHERGIIHRDLKPSNILVSPEPDNPYLTKILDFGIAKLAAPDLTTDAHTKSRTVAGTPHYMSPEQARALRDVDHRTDIYAVGVIAYELVTGRPPYIANSAGDLVYQQHTETVQQPVALCPGLPDAWNQLILDAIDLDPNRRPQSARELGARMIEATEHGMEIARATAPMLFHSAVSEPITGRSGPILKDFSSSSMPLASSPPAGGSPARPPATELPPARPPATAAPPPAAVPSGYVVPSQSSRSSILSSSGDRSQLSSSPPHMPTRDLRSGSGALPIAEGVPTTLGLSASEIPVFEGTAVGGQTQPRRGLLPWILGAGGIAALAAVAVFWAVGRGSAPSPDGDETSAANQPSASPLAGGDAGLAPGDAAIDAAATAASGDDEGDGDGVDDDGAEVSASGQRRSTGRKQGRHSGQRGTPAKTDAGAVSDDDLFQTRQ